MGNFVSASKTTFLYLLEYLPGLPLEKACITFLGAIPSLVRSPICLTERRVLLLSELESSEIVEISEEKMANPRRPFINEVHQFDNFGIIQQLEIDKEKKQLLINSYKPTSSLQSFQKGMMLETVSQFKVDLSLLRKTELVGRGDNQTVVFTFPQKTVFFHVGDHHQIYFEKKLSFDQELIHFGMIENSQYVVIGSTFIKVMKLWGHPQIITEENFPEETNAILSADSFAGEIFIAQEKSILFYTFSNNILQVTKEIVTPKEPKMIKCMYRKVFVGYWLEDHLDIYSISGSNHQRVNLGVKGIHTFRFFYSKAEDFVFLFGLTNGTVVQKIFGKVWEEKSSQVLVIGKHPVTLREVNIDQYLAISDESALLTLSNSSSAIDPIPLCHTDVSDIHWMTYKGTDYFLMLTKTGISINMAKNNSADNCRLKEIRLSQVKGIDKFIKLGEYLVTSYSESEMYCSEICVHDHLSNKIVHREGIANGLVESMMSLNFQDRQYILVGLNIQQETNDNQEQNRDESKAGRLKIYLLYKGELVEVLDSQQDRPVRSLFLLEGNQHLLVNIGFSQLKIFKIEQKLKKLPDRSVEVSLPQLKEIHQQKMYFMIDSISVLGNYILMSDYYWMAHVLLFENIRFPRFKAIGRLSCVSHEIVGSELLSPTRFAISDQAGNFMVYSLAEVGNNESDFIEFQDRHLLYLGEEIFSFKKGSRTLGIKFTDYYFNELSAQGELNFSLLGGGSGGLYVLYELPRKTYNLLEDLQRSILAARETESCVLKRKEYRRPCFKGIKTKPAVGIIDGDVLYSLLSMPDEEAFDIIKSMKHLNKPSLSTLRNLLRFLQTNPVN